MQLCRGCAGAVRAVAVRAMANRAVAVRSWVSCLGLHVQQLQYKNASSVVQVAYLSWTWRCVGAAAQTFV
jgi:hypothetical protein